MPRFLRSVVGFEILRPGCLPRQSGLGHQPPDVTLTILYIKLFTKVVVRKRDRPRRGVNPDFFGRLMESFNELFVLFFSEFR